MIIFKGLLEAAFLRIELIEELCLFKNYLTEFDAHQTIQEFQRKSKQMLKNEYLLIERLVSTQRCANYGFKVQFQTFSQTIFKHWESSFSSICIGKGKLNQIVQLYIKFFNHLKDFEVSSYISQMVMTSKSQNSTIFVLLNCVFRVLVQFTTKLIISLKHSLRTTRIYNPVKNSIPFTINNDNYQRTQHKSKQTNTRNNTFFTSIQTSRKRNRYQSGDTNKSQNKRSISAFVRSSKFLSKRQNQQSKLSNNFQSYQKFYSELIGIQYIDSLRYPNNLLNKMQYNKIIQEMMLMNSRNIQAREEYKNKYEKSKNIR